MNTLFVGSTKGSSTSIHYYSALLKLGHNVLPWDPEYFSVHNAVEKVVQRLNRGPSPWKVRRINEHLIRLCQQNHFDLVFVMSENYVSAEAIETIRREALTAPRFLYHSHDNVFSDGILKPADFYQDLCAYDAVFTTKSQNVARYKQMGQPNAFYIPSAYEPMVHRPIAKSESRLTRDFKVSFIGTYDHSRLHWLEKAGWERIHVWGDGWERFPEYQKHREHIYPHGIYYFEFADVCSRSRCSLGLLREEAEDLHTQRTFEIPATGSLQLAPDNEEIRGFFEDGKEIVLFRSDDELKDKLDYYLTHESERDRIAAAGFERCTKGGNSYFHRTQSMLRSLQEMGLQGAVGQ